MKIYNDKDAWESLRIDLIESISWKDAISKKYRIDISRVDNAIYAWVIHFATQGEDYVALNRAKSWCSNWIGKQLELMEKRKSETKPPVTYHKPVKFDNDGNPYTA